MLYGELNMVFNENRNIKAFVEFQTMRHLTFSVVLKVKLTRYLNWTYRANTTHTIAKYTKIF